ncbi:MAG: LysR family transcriptional regulator [Oscillospiraceae bacterium]|jgi:DNA-binding transcriptional LysR family regulator|nr:LysR family transcriptional regulator [Oscillospiraceae bacterium]
MTLQQIKYFIETVNRGSINKAAEGLFISQPSLSNSLKDLEAELGVELFTRTPKGVALTQDGVEFLGYARQVNEQFSLLEQRYTSKKPARRVFSVSAQHYAFAVNAFVNMVKKTNTDEYELTLRETETHDIVESVKTLRSEIGVLYLNPFNRKVMGKLLRDNRLAFHPLFIAKPHIFTGSSSPLARYEYVTPEDLEDYPCLSYEQGENNSFYFSEEILSVESHKKSIKVTDRATMFNLMIGLNGYTISSGVISADLNGNGIAAVPLQVDDYIEVGWIAHDSIKLTAQAQLYIDELDKAIKRYGVYHEA